MNQNNIISLVLRKDVMLSEYTTIGLGGPSEYFLICSNTEDIISGLKFASENNLPVQVLSGGSNIIFPDKGYDGLIFKIDAKGIEINEEGNKVCVNVKAGEVWDDVVNFCIERSLTGIECLSGIPGSTGATPVQNVGAYGQEVKDVIESVTAIDRKTPEIVTFKNAECNFGYRQSRFKNEDKDRFIITEVQFLFNKNNQPIIRYPELQKFIDSKKYKEREYSLKDKLTQTRNAVLELRKGKSMLIDLNDPNSRSCGSFFMNPVINENEYIKFISFTQNFIKNNNKEQIPVFRSGDKYKLSAAWLIEKSGFHKGFKKGGVGISEKHSLSLININGTTKELLELSSDIITKVFEKTGIILKTEPVVV